MPDEFEENSPNFMKIGSVTEKLAKYARGSHPQVD